MASFYRRVLDYAKYHDGRYVFKHPVPKPHCRPKDEVRKEESDDEKRIKKKEPTEE
jgi:hypothetical protein